MILYIIRVEYHSIMLQIVPYTCRHPLVFRLSRLPHNLAATEKITPTDDTHEKMPSSRKTAAEAAATP